MKTVYTTLPIYKALRDQNRERGLQNGSYQFAPIFCPKHRLPSFQWIDADAATVTAVYLEGDATVNITTYFQALPSLTTSDGGTKYFIYEGDTLNHSLPEGNYYLKIVMNTGHIYFSDWFLVQCVYCHFADSFANTSYDTFTISGTTIASAIDSAGAVAQSGNQQAVYLGQVITVMFYLTTTGATTPSFSVVSASAGVISNVATSAAGLNELTLTTTAPADDAVIRITNAGAANFSTSEILVYTQYACGYVTLSFSNCCNIGDLLYEDGFYQTLWLKSDNIEQSYPYTEKGQENGEGKFIPTFRRQEKVYTIRTGLVSQYMVDVLNRLKLHDVMTFIDQVGETFNVESVDVEYEWIFEDKYYATASITLNLGEEVVVYGCC